MINEHTTKVGVFNKKVGAISENNPRKIYWVTLNLKGISQNESVGWSFYVVDIYSALR